MWLVWGYLVPGVPGPVGCLVLGGCLVPGVPGPGGAGPGGCLVPGGSGPGGVWFQHALQVSRPTPKGED